MKTLKSVIIGFLLFSLLIPINGQSDYDKETFDDAEYFFLLEDYQEAIVSYLRLYKKGFKNNANINYRIGICYLNLNKDKEKAVPYLEFAVTKLTPKFREGELKEDNAPYDAWLYMGNAYRINMQHDKAIEAYNKFLELTGNEKNLNMEHDWARTQIEACKRAKVATNNLVRVKYQSLGKPINNTSVNTSPAISANEEYIAYISMQRFYSAVMFSYKKKGKWQTPRNITPEIESDGDQIPVYLSADGKTLLLAKFENENSDIYITTSNGKTWSKAQPINSKEINSKYWESHACLSPEGNTIYFTSNRPQSKGGTDIFYSQKTADGKWGPAVNMGDNINTRSNEETPSITPDGNTLYFSSQGHETIGGFDICYSTKDESGNWSKPVNLGYPLNTTDDDLFYIPVSDKHYAYQSKVVKGGMGELDIVRVETFSQEHPYTFSIRGNLIQLLKNEKPANYTIKLIDYESKKALDSIKPSANGDFSFLRVAGTYVISLVSDSFSTTGNYFIIPENYPSEIYSLTPEIVGVSEAYNDYLASKKGQKIVKQAVVYSKDQRPALIHNILFSFGESKLTKDAENELDTIAKLMLEVPSLKVEIIGYADALGSEQFNQQLSEKRAGSVKNWLLEKGVKSDRVQVSGQGEMNPIAINENPDGSDNPIGRAFNRRVEFNILKSDNKNIKVDHIKVPAELKP